MLTINNTSLRPPNLDLDLTHYYQIRNNVNIQNNLMSRSRPNSSEKVKDWLVSKNGQESSMLFTIVDENAKDFAGYIQITNIDFINSNCYFGIFITEKHRNKKHAENALLLIEPYLQSTFNIRKILLEVISDNKPAIKLYEKLGYYQSGLLKQHFYIANEYKDIIIMEKFIQ